MISFMSQLLISGDSWYCSAINDIIDIHPEVEYALNCNEPVVALESAVVTHGLPYPENFTTAKSLENIVRFAGSVPATIAIISGKIKVGLKLEELQRLADPTRNRSLAKVSIRDVSPCIALKIDGGTTCSATSMIASLCGIKVSNSVGLVIFCFSYSIRFLVLEGRLVF